MTEQAVTWRIGSVACTLKDIANLSGYSIATVSRVLSSSAYPVDRKAKNKILQTATELDYVPNLTARNLRNKSSNEIALIVPSVTNLFFSSIVTGVEESLKGRGYSLLIYLFSESDSAQEILNNLRGKGIGGLIIAADCVNEGILPQLCALRRNGVSVVVVDFEPDTKEKFRGVFFDYREGARVGTQYLLEAGHRRIAYLTLPIDRLSRKQRIEGFRTALRAYGIEPSAGDVFVSGRESGFEAGRELAGLMLRAEQPYTAVFANNDAVAVGVLTELQSRGIAVPGQISVMGFDDSVFAQMSNPKLTTVRVDGEAIGRHAGSFILAEQNGPEENTGIYLETRVIVRESVRSVSASS